MRFLAHAVLPALPPPLKCPARCVPPNAPAASVRPAAAVSASPSRPCVMPLTPTPMSTDTPPHAAATAAAGTTGTHDWPRPPPAADLELRRAQRHALVRQHQLLPSFAVSVSRCALMPDVAAAVQTARGQGATSRTLRSRCSTAANMASVRLPVAIVGMSTSPAGGDGGWLLASPPNGTGAPPHGPQPQLHAACCFARPALLGWACF